MSRAINALLTSKRPLIFGMIHLPPLPGSPCHQLKLTDILTKVKKETSKLIANDIDGIIVENMNDLPYLRPPASPEVIGAMTLACETVKKMCNQTKDTILVGVQILAAANREALAVAHLTELDFIRAEGFIYSHVADEGWIDGCAGSLLRYRSHLNAQNVAIFTDIKKKHSSHSVTNDINVSEMVKDAKFNRADGVIITGKATGAEANPSELNDALSIEGLPVLIGSGVNIKNMHHYKHAHGLIVGSEFKVNGNWENDIDNTRLQQFMKKSRNLRRTQ